MTRPTCSLSCARRTQFAQAPSTFPPGSSVVSGVDRASRCATSALLPPFARGSSNAAMTLEECNCRLANSLSRRRAARASSVANAYGRLTASSDASLSGPST